MNTFTDSEKDRRSILLSGWQWIKYIAAAVLLYPLLRFADFRVPPKPEIVTVPAMLPSSRYILQKDFILFDNKEGLWAVSRTCTHLGCRVNYVEAEGQLVCPCHQSRFSIKGKRLAGPAQKDLERYKVEKLGRDKGGGYLVIT